MSGCSAILPNSNSQFNRKYLIWHRYELKIYIIYIKIYIYIQNKANKAMLDQDSWMKGILSWKNMTAVRTELVCLISWPNFSGWIGYVGLLNHETWRVRFISLAFRCLQLRQLCWSESSAPFRVSGEEEVVLKDDSSHLDIYVNAAAEMIFRIKVLVSLL